MALQITDANFEELVNSGKPMFMTFGAEWCGPCRKWYLLSLMSWQPNTKVRVTIGK